MLDIYAQATSLFFFLNQRGHKRSQSPGRRKKTGATAGFKTTGENFERGGEKKSVCWSEREKGRREEDCCAGAILDFICLLGDGPPALKSPLGARIVREEPAIFCSVIYHCHHIMIPLAAPY